MSKMTTLTKSAPVSNKSIDRELYSELVETLKNIKAGKVRRVK